MCEEVHLSKVAGLHVVFNPPIPVLPHVLTQAPLPYPPPLAYLPPPPPNPILKSPPPHVLNTCGLWETLTPAF